MKRDLEKELEEFPEDVPMRRLLRELLLRDGTLEGFDKAIEQQEKIRKLVRAQQPVRSVDKGPEPADLEKQRLFEDRLAAARFALSQGALDAAVVHAGRAQRLEDTSPEPGLLVGDAHAMRAVQSSRQSDDRGVRTHYRRAVEAWGKTRSPLGLDRIAGLLDRHPGLLSPRDLLDACRLEGALVLVAREFARAGDQRRTARAVRLAMRRLDPTPATRAALADVLAKSGLIDDGRALLEQTSAAELAPGEAADPELPDSVA